MSTFSLAARHPRSGFSGRDREEVQDAQDVPPPWCSCLTLTRMFFQDSVTAGVCTASMLPDRRPRWLRLSCL